MILDDIFEAMKPSDIPTSMRSNRLTMRDIEAERPQGAYRFRVGDKEFMDLAAAREFAQGTGETVKPIRETVKKKLEDQQVNNLDEIENPFQQPAPIRSKDPVTGKQIEPENTPSEVPPQYANYQSNLARYMAKYGQPAAATAPAAPIIITPAATTAGKTAKVGAPAGKAALDTAVKTIDTVR
jgi:hypothetical protein